MRFLSWIERIIYCKGYSKYLNSERKIKQLTDCYNILVKDDVKAISDADTPVLQGYINSYYPYVMKKFTSLPNGDGLKYPSTHIIKMRHKRTKR